MTTTRRAPKERHTLTPLGSLLARLDAQIKDYERQRDEAIEELVQSIADAHTEFIRSAREDRRLELVPDPDDWFRS